MKTLTILITILLFTSCYRITQDIEPGMDEQSITMLKVIDTIFLDNKPYMWYNCQTKIGEPIEGYWIETTIHKPKAYKKYLKAFTTFENMDSIKCEEYQRAELYIESCKNVKAWQKEGKKKLNELKRNFKKIKCN